LKKKKSFEQKGGENILILSDFKNLAVYWRI